MSKRRFFAEPWPYGVIWRALYLALNFGYRPDYRGGHLSSWELPVYLRYLPQYTRAVIGQNDGSFKELH